MRAVRDLKSADEANSVRVAGKQLREMLERLEAVADLDQIRGIEGEAARCYFGAYGRLITVPAQDFAFALRTRRPPRDRVNALLSFAYALLMGECMAAIETVGLDPQLGYLHALRPGRPALSLDLMEEYRAGWADRLVLTLVNRRQIRVADFEIHDASGGTVQLTEHGRREVITAFREQALRDVNHPLIGRRMKLGLVPFVQAQLLARHLRDPSVPYHPFVWE